MKRFTLAVLFLLASVLPVQSKWLTVYHPTWWYGILTPAKIDFTKMTHIAIFPAQDASLTAPYFNKSNIEHSDLSVIISSAHAAGTKVLLSAVGGYGQVNINVISADEVKCQLFVDSACAYAKWRGFDGVELDWEFPRAADDVGWNKLIRKFRQKLDTWSPNKGILATSMFYSISGPVDPPYYVDSMMVFDQINLMSYTMCMGTSEGPYHSGFDTPVSMPTLAGYKGWSLDHVGGGPLTFTAAGYPASKLGLGISFEGTKFVVPTETWGAAYSSYRFCSSVSDPLSTGYEAIPTTGRVWDPIAQGNYAKSGTSFYSFQDTNSVKAIANWGNAQGWGGLMIYDLGTGTGSGANPNALLNAAASVALGTVSPIITTGTFTASTYSLPEGGGNVTLTWTSSNADSASISQGVGTVALSGSTTVSLTATKVYTLSLKNSYGAITSYNVTVVVASPPASSALVVYADAALVSPWTTNGANGVTLDMANTDFVQSGTSAIRVTGLAWGQMMFRNGGWGTEVNIDPSGYDSLHFAIYSANSAVIKLNLGSATSSDVGTAVQFTIPAGAWTIKSIPLASLVAPGVQFSLVIMQVFQPSASTFYLDDIRFVPRGALAPPAAPTLSAPSSGATGQETSVSLSWTTVSGATSYQYQYGTDTVSATKPVLSTTSTSATVTGLAYSTTYQWHARASNADGASAWTAWQTFTTKAAPVVTTSGRDMIPVVYDQLKRKTTQTSPYYLTIKKNDTASVPFPSLGNVTLFSDGVKYSDGTTKLFSTGSTLTADQTIALVNTGAAQVNGLRVTPLSAYLPGVVQAPSGALGKVLKTNATTGVPEWADQASMTANDVRDALNASTGTRVSIGRIASGTPTGNLFVRDDGVLASPSATSGDAKRDSFATTALLDTVAWSGVKPYDIVVISGVSSSAVDTLNPHPISVYPDVDRVIVSRKYGNASGQKYNMVHYAWADTTTPAAPAAEIALVDTAGHAISWDYNLTKSFTTSNTTNRYLIVFTSSMNKVVTDSVKYGTQKLVLLDSIGLPAQNHRLEAWGIVAPTVGTANIVSYSTVQAARSLAAMVYSGVNQTTPTGSTDHDGSTNTDAMGVTVSSATGEVVVDCVASTNMSFITATPAAGQTKTVSWSLSSGYSSLSASQKAGAASTDMTWGFSGTGFVWQIGVALKP